MTEQTTKGEGETMATQLDVEKIRVEITEAVEKSGYKVRAFDPVIENGEIIEVRVNITLGTPTAKLTQADIQKSQRERKNDLMETAPFDPPTLVDPNEASASEYDSGLTQPHAKPEQKK
jgi:hypothetical protein